MGGVLRCGGLSMRTTNSCMCPLGAGERSGSGKSPPDPPTRFLFSFLRQGYLGVTTSQAGVSGSTSQHGGLAHDL